jgi:hypothetical protein
MVVHTYNQKAEAVSFQVQVQLGLHSTTKQAHRNLLSHSDGGQKSKMNITRLKSKCPQGHSSLEALGGRLPHLFQRW